MEIIYSPKGIGGVWILRLQVNYKYMLKAKNEHLFIDVDFDENSKRKLGDILTSRIKSLV